MTDRPTGTVTFLFTDVEGSTQLWEHHPAEMRVALARHDEILRAAIERRNGYVFSTAGDAFSAAFASASDAIAAAVDAQLALATEEWPPVARLRVRMGLHTGDSQERDGDYFGPVLNRTARIMSAGHGGQILVAAATAALVPETEVCDLGVHRLKDLAEPEHLFQVAGDGLASDFAALRTVDVAPGNLRALATSFIGRDAQVKELVDLLGQHRLVTLTGVGGVGKTRLAVQVAAEMVDQFADGVWLVELASITDPAAVPEALATVLGVNAPTGHTMIDSLAETIVGRELLIVLDNCEHVLDAAAEMLEQLLARDSALRVLATSREGMQVRGEQLFAVSSLGVRGGIESPAADLFVERATALTGAVDVHDDDVAAAVVEICERLDGIPLAIELAAARTVSMTPAEIRDRLDDRFRLLSGSRRAMERHQTLRHAVAWSYDLLTEDEKAVLNRCSSFADGFDLAGATHICSIDDEFDEYAVLDVLDSLVRKSLVTIASSGRQTRYGMLETIRQFAEDQLAADGRVDQVRDRHARYFGAQAVVHWDRWEGPGFLASVDWMDAELANLRTGFRWAVDQADYETAATISANAAMLGFCRNRLEPVVWVEEVLEAATAADVVQLPRLYTSAAYCCYLGRPEASITYAEIAVRLADDPRYEPFDLGWARFMESLGYAYTGRFDRYVDILLSLVDRPDATRVIALSALPAALVSTGRHEEAEELADRAVAQAREHGNPCWLGFALWTNGVVSAQTDPQRTWISWREGLEVCRANSITYFEATISRDAADLVVEDLDLRERLELFDMAVSTYDLAGNKAQLIYSLSKLASFLERTGRVDVAAALHVAVACEPTSAGLISDLEEVGRRLRSALGDTDYERCLSEHGQLGLGSAARHARRHIQERLSDLAAP